MLLNYLGVSVLYEYAIVTYLLIAAFCAYFSKVRISHILPHKLAFSAAIFGIICVAITNFY